MLAPEGIHLVKIPTLAFDEQVPHGFVGYANLRVFHTQSSDPITASHKGKEKTPQIWGVFPLWRALEDSNLRPTGS